MKLVCFLFSQTRLQKLSKIVSKNTHIASNSSLTKIVNENCNKNFLIVCRFENLSLIAFDQKIDQR